MLEIVLTSSESDQYSSVPKEISKFPLMYMTGYFCRSVYNVENNNKSAGIDYVKNEHIKCTSSLMIPIYTKLFNIIFDTTLIPDSWTIGVIKPIYKKRVTRLYPKTTGQLPY